MDKWAVVTGAGKGIGKAISLKLAEQGYGIIAIARSVYDLQSLAKQIRDKDGQAEYLSLDLSKPDEIQRSVDFFSRFKNQVQVVVHNAGMVKVGSIAEIPAKDFMEVQDVNVNAPFLLTQILLPLMPAQSQFIFINSTAGKQSFADWGAYCVSKFALKALADTLRSEVEARGIRVTSIYPSAVDTPIHDPMPYDWDRSKMMQVEDVANAVVYCTQQPVSVRINEIELENTAGKF